jgi:hypothetical protein
MPTSFPVVGAGSNSHGTKYILFVAVAVGVIANVAVASFLIPGSAILSQPSPISVGFPTCHFNPSLRMLTIDLHVVWRVYCLQWYWMRRCKLC